MVMVDCIRRPRFDGRRDRGGRSAGEPYAPGLAGHANLLALPGSGAPFYSLEIESQRQ